MDINEIENHDSKAHRSQSKKVFLREVDLESSRMSSSEHARCCTEYLLFINFNFLFGLFNGPLWSTLIK